MCLVSKKNSLKIFDVQTSKVKCFKDQQSQNEQIGQLLYHKTHNSILLVAQNNQLFLTDTRFKAFKSSLVSDAHLRQITSLDQAPSDEYLLGTTGIDGFAKLWDF
jgi:WD40 repeat protein